METLIKIVGIVVVAVLAAFALSLVFAFPVMWLWNSTMPELFGFKEIGLWMAWKVGFLCSLLFKGVSTK